MTRNQKLATILSALLITFFNYGCTSAQRHELLMDAKEIVVKELKDQLPKLKDAAIEASTAFAEKKLAEAEAKKLTELDLALAQLKIEKEDPDTGMKETIVKTWKDFDEDKSGTLSSIEAVKLGGWIGAETARRVAAGQMSKDEAGRIGKSSAATLAGLLLILMGKRAVTAVAKKKAPAPATPAA